MSSTAKPTAPPVLKVYPVPARDQLVVEGAAKRLEVINLLGAVVLRAERAEDSAPWILDVRGLPAGAYVLRSDAGQPLRFVKQ
ncbi:MAG: T9SS type A sorting domain-containing protein [Schleiferiaceae bacterium]